MSSRHLAALLVAFTLALGACARTVLLEPAPWAADPVCGNVIVKVRGERFGFRELGVGAQGTIAWGDDAGEIVLRCGVDPPPPTTDRCVTIETSDGVAVDWINPEIDSEMIPPHADTETGSWTFITYGRVPAIEVTIPSSLQIEPADVLQGLASAVGSIPQERFCVGATDYVEDAPASDG